MGSMVLLKMYERGLIYRRQSQVNWCPKEETVLSNEQSSGGVCWRCETPVVKKDLEQWFVRITDYAERLLEDMKELEAGWPARVLTMQRHWIGRSEGAYVDFQIKDQESAAVRIFTTRIDTIYGANAIVLAPDHPLLAEALKNSALKADVDRLVEKIGSQRQAMMNGEAVEKEGVNTGLLAINPFNGEQLLAWAANYVLMEYGTGAVMSVPAHDERDFEFAQKYKLPIKQVIAPITHDQEPSGFAPALGEDQSTEMLGAVTDYGVLVNSGEWSGKLSTDAVREMADYAEKKNFGSPVITYRLRDWGISRQRFWGAPIPIIYCDKCGAVPVPEKDLPVRLPEQASFTGTGQSPLASVPEFVNTTCPSCGGSARRETDTMDTFVDSSWYIFRYIDPRNDAAPFDTSKARYWTPVDQYIGGVEHAVMHLLYTRFWTKFMRDIGLVDFNEPVKKLMTQGMVVAETFYRQDGERQQYFNFSDVAAERDAKGKVISAKLISDGELVSVGAVEKMSKSKNNGVDPDEMIESYGADSVRLFTLFAAPVENDLRWQEAGIEGAQRFIQRVHRIIWRWTPRFLRELPRDAEIDPASFTDGARSLRRKTHQTIARVTKDFEGLHFNTSVAALMELTNMLSEFEAAPAISAGESDAFAVREALEALVVMLAPYAPHAAEEMWEGLGHEGGLLLKGGARWPRADEELARAEELEIPVQVNGKLRARVRITPDTSGDELTALALEDDKVRATIDGREIVKVIVVPQRLVNIVVR
ncbi:MAG: leucine--tRNA ligase [Pyrinomonadaceae bacterium]